MSDPIEVDYKEFDKLYLETKKNKFVKRLAYGYDKADDAMSKIRAHSTKYEGTHRCMSNIVRAISTIHNVTIGEINFRAFYWYTSGTPTELYVAMENESDYKKLKEIIYK